MVQIFWPLQEADRLRPWRTIHSGVWEVDALMLHNSIIIKNFWNYLLQKSFRGRRQTEAPRDFPPCSSENHQQFDTRNGHELLEVFNLRSGKEPNSPYHTCFKSYHMYLEFLPKSCLEIILNTLGRDKNCFNLQAF